MKKTITGWLNKHKELSIENLQNFQIDYNDIPIAIIYDDGKPATKTVWEWMIKPTTSWILADHLATEDEAKSMWPTFPHKKVRSFEVEE